MKRLINKFFLFTAVFTLLFSLFGTVTAFADDGVPPVATDQPVATDEPVATDVPAVTDATPAPADTAADAQSVMEQIPADTTVVVLDASGEPLPLASQDAASAFVSGDPMWCPSTVTPGTAAPGQCTASHTSLTDLITDLMTNSSTYIDAGTIYIAWDYDASTSMSNDYGQDIIFDYSQLGLTDLTVQGGWDFTTDSITSQSDLTGINSLNFYDWGALDPATSLTINDIILNGPGWNGTTPMAAGLYVGNHFNTPNGDVTLNNVSVTNSYDYNVMIYTGNGGDVNIDTRYTNDQSDFSGAGSLGTNNSNNTNGLWIQADGAVTAYNVTSNGNKGWMGGAYVYANNGDIYIADSKFNNNDGNGLRVEAVKGNVTINKVTANGNIGNGFYGQAGGKLLGKNPSVWQFPNKTVDVSCSDFASNKIGAYAYAPTMNLNGNTFSGNGTDYQNQVGTVNVTTNCNPAPAPSPAPAATTTPTLNNTFVPASDTTSVQYEIFTLTEDQLPAVLGQGGAFASALKLQFFASESDVTLSFPIPASMKGANLAVLFWNGAEWVEIPGGHVAGDTFMITVSHSGVYVLVSK